MEHKSLALKMALKRKQNSLNAKVKNIETDVFKSRQRALKAKHGGKHDQGDSKSRKNYNDEIYPQDSRHNY